MNVIAVVNFKGGVAKTSSVVGLGESLARSGKRVLLVDCDPQAHVSAHLGIDADELDVSLTDVLEKGVALQDIILETAAERLLVAPSKRSLAEARTYLASRKNRDATLAKALRGVEQFFDYLLIDTPPDEGILSVNAMYAAQYIVIPTPLDSFSLKGINTLIESIVSLQEAYEYRSWSILGVLVNRYDRRLGIENRMALKVLEEAFEEDGLLFDTRVRVDECVRQAQRKGLPIKQYSPTCKAAEDYEKLAREIETRLNQHSQTT